MYKFLKVLFTGIIVSFYFFPFEFSFLPGINTKMALAGLSLVLILIDLARNRFASIDSTFVILSFYGLLVSLCGFFAVTINNTRDYVYATYFISMWVWLGGAYTVISWLRYCFGKVDVIIVCKAIIGVCVAQCLIAMIINDVPAFGLWVNSWCRSVATATSDYFSSGERLYGIGAGLDIAGTRFAVALIMITYMLKRCIHDKDVTSQAMYILAFWVIAIIGNMISRTTSLGLLLSFAFFMLPDYTHRELKRSTTRVFLCSAIIIIPFIVLLYNYNTQFHENIRFGFEGFFSLVEEGKWKVQSNERLMDMFVLPDNTKTWLIGDGYFADPYYSDPYYSGPDWKGFYKATDVGYLRFIFYFGVVGLTLFVLYMYQACRLCGSKIKEHRLLFYLILIINYVVWFKVSTDVFLVFALFLCLPHEETIKETV